MANFFTDFIKGPPKSLEELSGSLALAVAERPDFISLLKEHHRYLEQSIGVLMDKEATDGDKQSHLFRFFRLVEMHGKAEEETLYAELQKNYKMEARLEGLGGQDEHDLAFLLESELIEMDYLSFWSEEIAAKAKIVAGLVKNHIKEEETKMFPIAKNDISSEILESLCINYVQKCRVYLDQSRTSAVKGQAKRRRTEFMTSVQI